MKNSIVLITLVLLVSCCQNNQPVLSTFPSTLKYDSTIIISTHVYNWEEEMDTVNQSLIEFKSIQQVDSLRILTPRQGLRYSHTNQAKHHNNKNSNKEDSIFVIIHPDSLIIGLVHPPELVVIPDTRAVHNAQVYRDSTRIQKKFTKTFYRSGNKFYLNQYAVKLMTPSVHNPGTFGGYTIARLNDVNIPYLRKNLEVHEYLTVFTYCEVYILSED